MSDRAPRVLITSSPEVWMHVNNKSGYKRSDRYYKAVRIEYQRDNIFSQTNNAKHERRRKQMAPGAPFIGRFIAPSPKDNNGFGKMMATCFRLVDERAASPADQRSNMLASFMRHSSADDELRTEALEQIIAGSDTTAGHSWRSSAPHDESPTGGGLITATQTRQLPYLQAVIREALRVWPPVVNIFSRDVPTGGDTLVVDGESVFLPGGVCIDYSAYSMHQSEKIYGKDAKGFRPERWLEADPAALAVMIRTNDLIFGHGKFQCLGKAVAQIEIEKTVFELLRNFDLARINPTRPWDARNYLGLFAISNMYVQVMERTPCSP
ncbi:hypothetical protein PENDEC_c002G05703 [Penicillium decumbens]|uniref:Uncharacterized protein n=1 Tax=Penicillium decumbens TaxID=69771 RepID=A0A1V6PKK2_PENDC|nr:hypothetical protein PENDEC_c002G05703 [Penicillium decumbens]